MNRRRAIADALLARLIPCIEKSSSPRQRVFNPALARALAQAPAASALAEDMTAPMAVDSAGDELFRLTERGTLLLSPALLGAPRRLGAVMRWAQEAAFLSRSAQSDRGAQARAFALAAQHGAALIERLPQPDREALHAWIPKTLWRGDRLEGGPDTAKWLAKRLRSKISPPDEEPAAELAMPVEALLEVGGDARIVTSPGSEMNRYGATSRPRPEAVHFSSSTASSVSDYVFAALDRARRALLAERLYLPVSDEMGRLTFAHKIGHELLEMHGLTGDDADVVIAPSGTDAELLAVLIALGADDRLANILIAPEETGRSVKVAAAGHAFHEGGAFENGAPLWPDADIEVASAGVRAADGSLLPGAQVESAVKAAVDEALGEGRRVLLHVLLGSKTGVSAPSPAFVAGLGAPGERIDVVADSCQGRIPGDTIGAFVRAGWMTQISGSKFFTGPPFSGALLIPASLRVRRQEVARRLARTPQLAPMEFWSGPGDKPSPTFRVPLRALGRCFAGPAL